MTLTMFSSNSSRTEAFKRFSIKDTLYPSQQTFYSTQE
jgi:hypothetical protein